MKITGGVGPREGTEPGKRDPDRARPDAITRLIARKTLPQSIPHPAGTAGAATVK